MNTHRTPSPRARGEGWGEGPRALRGWAGVLMLLVVVLIVGFLARDALLKYLGPAQTVQRETPRTQLDPATSDATSATPSPGNAMDRARSLQDTLQKESEKRGGDD